MFFSGFSLRKDNLFKKHGKDYEQACGDYENRGRRKQKIVHIGLLSLEITKQLDVNGTVFPENGDDDARGDDHDDNFDNDEGDDEGLGEGHVAADAPGKDQEQGHGLREKFHPYQGADQVKAREDAVYPYDKYKRGAYKEGPEHLHAVIHCASP